MLRYRALNLLLRGIAAIVAGGLMFSQEAVAQMTLGSYDLEGPVKKVRETEFRIQANGAKICSSGANQDVYMEFSRNGNLLDSRAPAFMKWGKVETRKAFFWEDCRFLREEKRVNDTLTEFAEFDYDAHENQVNECRTKIEGKDTTVHQILRIYDRYNRCIGFRIYTNDALTSWSLWTLDKAGNDLFLRTYDANGPKYTSIKSCDAHGNEILHVTLDTPWKIGDVYRTVYNARSQKVKQFTYSGEGKITQESTYRYHANGVLATEISYYYPRKIVKAESLSDYFFIAGGGIEPASYYVKHYDAHGNITLSATNNVGPIQRQTWVYTYDRYGSWLTRTYNDFTMTVREIEYY